MKIAVVTGSNKGIGRGIVETLAKLLPKNEWIIYLTARNPELGCKTIEELVQLGLDIKFHQLDIDCESSRKVFKEYLTAKYGGLDILINNAAIAYKQSSTAPFAEQAEVTMKTNFFNTLKMCQEFLPILRKDARLVNVSSLAAPRCLKAVRSDLYSLFTSPMTVTKLEEIMHNFVKAAKEDKVEENGWVTQAYGTSKLGVTKMTFILAEELKGDPRNILINSCCPGYVDTDMTSHTGKLTIYQGADTPVYLATLPIGTSEPNGKFVFERKIFEWK